jgi:ribose transport system substrate-binding protein
MERKMTKEKSTGAVPAALSRRRTVVQGLLGLGLAGAGMEIMGELAYANTGNITIGMSWPNLKDAVWTASKANLEQLARETSPPIKLTLTLADGDVAKQASDIRDLISRRVNILQIAPVDSKAVGPSIRAARHAGIPVMAFLLPIDPKSKYQPDVFVGIDTEYQQYSSAKTMFELMKKDGAPIGDFLWVSGDLRDENARRRTAGVRRAAAEFGANLVQDLPGNWDPQQAAAVLAPALRAHPNVNALAIAADAMLSGVVKVMQDAGRWYPHGNKSHMYFSSVDVSATGVSLLQGGFLDADALFDVKGMCKSAIDIAPTLAAGGKLNNILIKGPVYTPYNINDPSLKARLWAD